MSGEIRPLLDSLDEIRNKLTGCDLKLEFPAVIVCGQESTGKSSVLERLCMFPFFPRDHGITTRMPVRLRLRYADAKSLEQVAQNLGRDFNPDKMYICISFKDTEKKTYAVNSEDPGDGSRIILGCQSYVLEKHSNDKSFCREPLLIEAWSRSLPDLELIDLPGVYNAKVEGEGFDIVETTHQITQEYLRKPNCLVVAVVPATIDRIRNDVVLGMIQKCGKEPWTICALTKSDKCNRSDYSKTDPYFELKNRARGLADDCPKLGGGYIALRNRDSRQAAISLSDAADKEEQWFREHMLDLVKEGHATAKCLIQKIGSMMISFTISRWAPSALEKIGREIENVNKKLKMLGEDPARDPEGLASRLVLRVLKLWKDIDIADIVRSSYFRLQNEQRENLSAAPSLSSTVQAVKFKSACASLKEEVCSFFPSLKEAIANSMIDPCRKDNNEDTRLCRFHELHTILESLVKEKLANGVATAERRWREEFPLLVIVVTTSRVSLNTAVEQLACSIALSEIGSECLWTKNDFSSHAWHHYLKESCEVERANLKMVLNALSSASIQIKDLTKKYVSKDKY